MKIKAPIKVVILNAREGESRFTSMRRANEMVERGVATYEAGKGLTILDEHDVRRMKQLEAAQRREDAIVDSRNGVIWWNGADTRKNAMHLPFTNVSFPRPDSRG